MGLAFHSTCRSWSALARGFGGGEGWWREVRLGFSLQIKGIQNLPLGFSLGFLLLKKGWNSGPVNRQEALTALSGWKGAPPPQHLYQIQTIFCITALHSPGALWSRPESSFCVGDPGSSGLALPSTKESPSKEGCHTLREGREDVTTPPGMQGPRRCVGTHKLPF